MHILILLFLFITSWLPGGSAQEKSPYDLEKSFVVLIPSYNNSKWFERNLDSILTQSYKNFRVIYIDDASPDGTGQLVQDYIEQYGHTDKVTLVRNKKRLGALANFYQGAWMCAPEEIIVLLDGDDWVSHRDVLQSLESVYQDPDVWLTYGQFVVYPHYFWGFGHKIPDEVVNNNDFRSYQRGGTVLRSFYAGLFHQIKKEDLLYEGEFLPVCSDLAYMFPLTEMAGWHIRFIPEANYVYNKVTGINDHTLREEEQIFFDGWLRKQKKYEPVEHYNPNGKRKKIYVTPGQVGRLFDYNNPTYNRDNGLAMFCDARKQAALLGYDVIQADSVDNLEDFEYLIVFEVVPYQIPILERYPKEKLILFLWEPPSVIPENYEKKYHYPFSKVYTWRDDFIDNVKYFKLRYAVHNPMIEDLVDFSFKRFATTISANKDSPYPTELYTERRKLINFYETFAHEDFDFYGKGWPDTYKTYQGPVDKKVDYLKHYKFAYAYENIKGMPGYISEKIFDCFQAGAVPIYWGAPNVTETIPKECFIAREDFSDDHELYRFLKGMSEETYQGYIENIRKFLDSDAAKLHTIDYFVKFFLDIITSRASHEKN